MSEPLTDQRLREIREQIEQRYRADIAALDRVEAFIAEYKLGSVAIEKPKPAPIPAPTPALPVDEVATADESRQWQDNRADEVIAMLESGEVMADISRKLGIAYHRVTSIRKAWERKTGKKYFDYVKYGFDGEKSPDDRTLQEQPIAPPPVVAPPSRIVDLRNDCAFSADQITDFRARMEAALKRRGPLAWSRMLAEAELTPLQGNAALPHPEIVKIDGLWQVKPTMESEVI